MGISHWDLLSDRPSEVLPINVSWGTVSLLFEMLKKLEFQDKTQINKIKNIILKHSAEDESRTLGWTQNLQVYFGASVRCYSTGSLD